MVSWKGGEPGYIPIIVTGRDFIYIGSPGESHMQLGSAGMFAAGELRAYYNPQSNYMQITSHGPENVPKRRLGWMYDEMSKRWPQFGMKTRVNFLGHYEVVHLGDVFADVEARTEPQVKRPPEPIRPEPSVEGYYPSGTPIRYGDRRPVKVRSHLRRRIVDHLESPPKVCLCHRSKWVNNRRKGLIRRLK